MEPKRYTDRAFPPYRHEPGRTPHPERSPEGYRYQRTDSSFDPVSLSEAGLGTNESYRYGLDLFNAGYFWEAHAVWEELWVAAEADDVRTYLQSLIQLAAACLKRAMGEPRGAAKLFASARARVDALAEDISAPTPVFAGTDLRELRAILDGHEREHEGSIYIVLDSE